MPLDEIVQVTITRETTAISRTGFGIMMVLGAHKRFLERIKYYASASEMVTDGFLTTDAEHIAATDYFAQDPKPAQIAIGRRQVDRVTINIDVVQDSTDYTINIEGTTPGTPTPFTINSGVAATQTSICDALVVAIDAGSEPVDATNVGDDVQIDSDPAGSAFVVTIGTPTLLSEGALGTAEDADTALAAIQLVDNDWYGLMLTDRTMAQVLLAAAWVEADYKLFIAASSDSDIVDKDVSTDTSSIAYTFKANSYARSAALYHSSAATEYADAAWFGNCLPYDAGSITWMFKTLSSVTVDTLTTTQRNNAWNKYANTYDAVASVNITRKGTVGENEYLDVIRGVDWLRATMQEDIYQRLVSQPKVPYTDAGIASIESLVRKVLEDGIEQGFLASIDSLSVPAAANVSAADKAARLLKDVTFQATLAGAIHEIQIDGVVTV